MSTLKSAPKKLTRTRRRSKMDKILAGEVPRKQKNIRTTRDPGAAPQRKAKDIVVITPRKKKPGKTPYIIRDEYFYEAKKLGYRARSAFKLLEIQEKYNVIRPGMQVLDIASAPGSWLQVLAKTVGPTGIVAGVDIQKIAGLGYPNVHLFQGDVFVTEPIVEFLKWLGIVQVDCVTSDIAAHTTGQTGVDQYRSVELNLAILDIAHIFLKKWGTLILKVFVWEDVNDLIGPIKNQYTILHRCKPKACRERSFEEYFVCQGKKE